MTDLVEFLRARLDEREAKARAAMHGGEGRWRQRDADRRPGLIVDERDEVVTYDEDRPTPEQTAHIEDNDPASVLREVEAKRRRITLALALIEQETGSPAATLMMRQAGEEMLHLEALSYADNPEYRETWKP